MKKTNLQYICSECNTSYTKWIGKCTNCNNWNTVSELKSPSNIIANKNFNYKNTSLIEFTNFQAQEIELIRYKTDIQEFDRVCGSGIVPGSVILLGGDPGVGKSTLLLQVIAKLASKYNTAYISGEESTQQLKGRAQRLGLINISAKLASASSLKSILLTLSSVNLDILIIDSIQTMYLEDIESIPGSVTQVRACALEIINFCKSNNVAAILVGHVTRDGQIAGPKVLEHMVDAVLQFEGENNKNFRILRTIKNRFGSSDEIGVFAMTQEGLVEINNPSSLFLSDYKENISGNAIFAGLEGSRAVLIEVQTLVSNTSFASPRRSVIGVDLNRLYMLIALLETRYKIFFNYKDVYANIAGGLKINEPAIDLAICAALISAVKDIPLPPNTVFIGEISLSGQIRTVPNLIKRLNEASRLGFKTAYIPKTKTKTKTKLNSIPKKLLETINIIELNNINSLLQIITHGF